MKSTVLRNVRILDPSRNLDETGTIIIGEDGRILACGRDALNQGVPHGSSVRDCQGLIATPGLVDARVRNIQKRSSRPAAQLQPAASPPSS